jgi:hypothetical protein
VDQELVHRDDGEEKIFYPILCAIREDLEK